MRDPSHPSPSVQHSTAHNLVCKHKRDDLAIYAYIIRICKGSPSPSKGFCLMPPFSPTLPFFHQSEEKGTIRDKENDKINPTEIKNTFTRRATVLAKMPRSSPKTLRLQFGQMPRKTIIERVIPSLKQGTCGEGRRRSHMHDRSNVA